MYPFRLINEGEGLYDFTFAGIKIQQLLSLSIYMRLIYYLYIITV